MKRVTDKSGYITLEASIFLPIFILALLALGYYIKIYGVLENVSYVVMDETARISSRAYVVKSVPGFEAKLEKRIAADVPEAVDVGRPDVRYLYFDGSGDDMISVTGEYKVDTRLPMGMDHTVEMAYRLKCRGFTGVKNDGIPMSFDEMESEGIWEPVWIFPDNGEKYHSETCTHVVSNARKMVLTGDIKKRFEPCSQCDAKDVLTGSFVYCFMKNGTVYHKEDCRQVTRYTIEVNRDYAIEKGYSPCSKCGGG